MANDANQPREGQISTDQTTIRKWAEEHSAIPVRRREGSTGASRIRVVPETDIEESHERVKWDAFFEEMDEMDYVVVYRESNTTEPLKVIERDEAITRSSADQTQIEESLLEGETVRSEIVETTTIESVIVEEATIESELVDTEVIDQRVVDAELVNRECTDCTLIDREDAEHNGWFDSDRYLDSIDIEHTNSAETDTHALDTETEIPYNAELEVEEQWIVTRELLERFTVESHITDTDITETDNIEDHDIDISGVHQTIAESGLLDDNLSPDEVMTHYDIESEIAADEQIHTHFDRERIIEDEVVDRKRLQADITGGNLLEIDIVHSEDIASEFTNDEGLTPTEEASTGTDESMDIESGLSLTDDEIRKNVVDANGKEVGLVTDVEEDNGRLYVEAHPGIADRIKAALDWGDTDEDNYPIHAEQIERVTDDEIKLKESEKLDESDRAR